MSVSSGALTLHSLSANQNTGFSASAALQSRAAERERQVSLTVSQETVVTDDVSRERW